MKVHGTYGLYIEGSRTTTPLNIADAMLPCWYCTAGSFNTLSQPFQRLRCDSTSCSVHSLNATIIIAAHSAVSSLALPTCIPSLTVQYKHPHFCRRMHSSLFASLDNDKHLACHAFALFKLPHVYPVASQAPAKLRPMPIQLGANSGIGSSHC
jgi:hypothetical protein